MKFNLFRWAVTLALMAMPLMMTAQYGVWLEEDFDECTGALPEGWTQESVKGEQAWVVETGGDYPDGDYTGGKRIALRNETQVTEGFVTKLITPQIDLSNTTNPVLCFAHAQPQWAGDFDILRIYYRTGPKEEWMLLKEGEYADMYIPQWRMDTIDLGMVTSSEYQLAFEGTDRLGRGIVLDNIVVRSAPTCISPDPVSVTEVENTTANINFSFAFDALEARVVVATKPLNEETLDAGGDAAIVKDEKATDSRLSVEGLQPNTQYYVYVKQTCLTEESTWSTEATFTTASVTELPYHETFDMAAGTQQKQRLVTWTWYNEDGDYVPYINADEYAFALGQYSPDGTTALLFTAEDDPDKPMAAGNRVYAVTPRLNVDDIAKCQVSFTGTYYAEELKQVSRRLTVGVMEKTTDFGTFKAVKTVELTQCRAFEQFIIPLEEYTGTGKYVAFVSDFDEENVFYMDNLTIERLPDCRDAYDIELSLESATAMSVNWKSSGAEKGDVIVSATEIDTAAIDLTAATLKAEDADLREAVSITGLAPQTDYWFSVRNKCDAPGAWSMPEKFRTPGVITLPKTFDFEDGKTYEPKYISGMDDYALPVEMLTIDNMGDNASRIYSEAESGTEYLPQRSENRLELTATPGSYSYVIFPEVQAADGYTATLWYGTYRTAELGTEFEAGLMGDAADPESFEPLATLTTGETWQKASFDITGKGFFAVRIENPEEAANTAHAYIDDVTFSEIAECKEPKGIEVTPGEFTATVTWEAGEGTEWNIRVTKSEVHTDSLSSNTFTDFAFTKDGLTEPKAEVTALQPKQTKYYVYVGTVCADGSCVWTGATEFLTECPAYEELEYIMDFDGYETGDLPELSVPCLYTDMKYDANSFHYFPQLCTSPSVSGNALALNYISYSYDYDLYVALPLMNPDYKLSELQINMQVYPYYADEELAIGLMSDPNDLSTFDTVSVFSFTTEKKWDEIIATVPGEETTDKHIAIRTAGPFAIDNIRVKMKDECFKVQKPEARDITDHSAEIRWTADTEQSWDILVSKTPIDYADLSTLFASPTADIVFNETVTERPYTVDGLTPSTAYNVYVRANCGNNVTGEWANDCAAFTTECVSLTVGDKSLETFDNYGTGAGNYPFCWIVGTGASIQVGEYMPYCSDEYSHSSGSSLQFHTTSTFNDGYAITTEIDTTGYGDISRLQVSFYGTCGSYALPKYECQLIVGIVSSPDEWGTFIPIDTVTGYADEQYYTVPFSTYRGAIDGSKGAYVAFRSNFQKENRFFIDDVRIDPIPDCPAPHSVKIDGTEGGSVTASWNGGSAPYTVVVSDRPLSTEELNSGMTGEGIITEEANGTTITVSGLEANLYYYLYVQSGCDEGEGGWSNAVQFKNSDCPEIVPLPYTDDFNSNLMSGEAVNPNCWTVFYNGISNGATYPYVDTEGRSGKSVMIETESVNDKLLMISPELDAADLSACQATFYISGSDGYQRSIVIGTVGDASDETQAWNTFSPIDTILCNTSSWVKCVIPLSGTDRRVAFSTVYSLNYEDDLSRGIRIDDIDIETIPTCPRPDDLQITNRDDNSVGIRFTELALATSWELQYGEEGFEAGKGTSVSLSSTEHTITGLTAQTRYDIYVRSLCGAGDESRWTGPLTAETTPLPIAASESETIDFEDSADNAFWLYGNSDQTNAWHIGTALAHGETGNALYISNDNGASATYTTDAASTAWAYRYITLEAGVYTFSYDWTCYGEADADYMKIALIPSSASVSGGEAFVRLADGEKLAVNATNDSHALPYLSLQAKDVNALNMAEGWQSGSCTYVIDESMAGTYALAVMWTNNGNGGDKPSPSAAVDNIRIDYNPCVYPTGIRLENLTADGGTLTWQAVGTPESFDIVVMDALITPDDPEAEGHKTIEKKGYTGGTSLTLSELNAGTYYAYVRQNCSATSGSQWSEPLMFATPCGEYYTGENGFTFDFDDAQEHTSLSEPTDLIQPDCFIIGHQKEGITDAADYISVKKNPSVELLGMVLPTGTSARSGEYSLGIDASAEAFGGYIALPPFHGNLDTMQVTFWMRAHWANTQPSIQAMYLDRAANAMTITVGTMTNPYDASTFAKISDVTYPYYGEALNPENDPSGEKYWVKFTVPLGARTNGGNYIAFLCDTTYTASGNDLYIDDITVESANKCGAPYDLAIDSIGDKAARLTFAYSGNQDEERDFEVHVSSKADMSDTVFLDTVQTGRAVLSGLTPSSGMYVRVQQLCGDGETSGWSQTKSFQTTYGIRYLEDFSGRGKRLPDGWSTIFTPAETDIESVFADEGYTFSGNSWTMSEGWTQSDESGLAGNHLTCKARPYHPMPTSPWIQEFYAYWLFTPLIHIDGENAHLTFDIAATMADSNEPMSEVEKGDASSAFIVAASLDGNDTWERLAVWDNTGNGDYVFDDITATGENVRIDLSKYAGRTLRLALFCRYYRPEVTPEVTMDLHIDNFRISGYYNNVMPEPVCQSQDYFGNGFNLLADDIEENTGSDNKATFERMVYVPESAPADQPDTVYSLVLTVNPMMETFIADTICEGRAYAGNGFDGKTEAQLYKRKIAASNNCDSVISLDLTVIESKHVTVFDTICQGGHIIWNGKEYDEQGIYTDTLPMSGCGCDSIVTLALHVTGALATADEVTICHGDSIEIGTLGFKSVSGLYRDTIHLPSGCDSIIAVDLTVQPEFVTVIDTAICLGETYEDETFVGGYGETGSYPVRRESVDGCDSTVTLNLIVIDPYNPVKVERSISRDELPYTFYGETFDANTPDGATTRTVTISNSRCSGTVELTLYVNVSDAVDNIRHTGLLTLTPNPVNAGEEVTVHLSLNAAQRDGLTVQVFSGTGAMVQSFAPGTEEIVIRGLYSSGVYIVRIIDGTGRTYQGKVIVR